MTFGEAIALQPVWVQFWLNILGVGAFIVPVSFLIWRQSRIAGIVTLVTVMLAGGAIFWMYSQMGYVRLLGLPHVVLWTPLAVYLWRQIRRADMPVWPRRLMGATLAVIVVSLVFDYVDVARWVLGEREAVAGTFRVE